MIPLDEVRHGWSSKQYPHQVKTMSSYLGIYEDMFDGRSFRPTVVMNVNYQDGDSVHYGNFLQPVKVKHLTSLQSGFCLAFCSFLDLNEWNIATLCMS